MNKRLQKNLSELGIMLCYVIKGFVFGIIWCAIWIGLMYFINS